jgi:hypothetical protein
MKRTTALLAVLFAVPLFASAQGKSNDQIERQIRSLGVEKQVSVSFDQSGNTSRLKAVAEIFRVSEAGAAGVRAMNFALGFFYAGNVLQSSPNQIMLSFWVMSKKPRFADNHHLVVDTGSGQIDLGEGRYSPKPQMDMEYLNYEITLQDLTSVAAGSNVVFKLGQQKFSATPDQLKMLKAVARIADVSQAN